MINIDWNKHDKELIIEDTIQYCEDIEKALKNLNGI